MDTFPYNIKLYEQLITDGGLNDTQFPLTRLCRMDFPIVVILVSPF